MTWEKSEIMKGFLKIAEERGMIPEKNPHQEDLKIIEEKRLPEPDKSIIEEAHPEPVFVAESRGDGALVENQIEQQNKMIEMLNKMPTGSLVGRYASAANELIKMANQLDELGQNEAADSLTDAAENLLEMATNLPFDKAPAGE